MLAVDDCNAAKKRKRIGSYLLKHMPGKIGKSRQATVKLFSAPSKEMLWVDCRSVTRLVSTEAHVRGYTGSTRGAQSWIIIVIQVFLLVQATALASAEEDLLTRSAIVAGQSLSYRALADVIISPGLKADQETLLQWKEHWMSYPAQTANATEYLSTWIETDSSPCGWQGVVCGSAPTGNGSRVTGLIIVDLGLSGTLPEDGYANLTACTTLILSGNQINGTIPTGIAQMPRLQILDLAQNLLNAGIPDEFKILLAHLVSFNISDNNLTAAISPTLFSSCASLVAFNLSKNVISGDFPQLVENCGSLRTIDLSRNSMTGMIPPELGSLPLLHTLVLSENQAGGPIPLELFSNCANLEYLYLGRMGLTGTIPKELATCGQLKLINLQSNHLTGSIPPILGTLNQLYCLALGNNSIQGPLPDELSNLVNLQYLDLSVNEITGSIPASYSNLANLLNLALQQNLLMGTFPLVVTSLSNLKFLDLSLNYLSGSIPVELGKCTNLTSLLLAHNNFSGQIPAVLSSLTKLQVLDLSANQLEGRIPSSLGKLQFLLWLQLANNFLTGSIPPELGNCSSLVWLNLYSNFLSGPIPNSFQYMGNSVATTFQMNQQDLPLLPVEMGECGALERWLPGAYEPYSFLKSDLSQQGSLCPEWWNRLLKGQLHPGEADSPLAFMQLSTNNLSGPIPSYIGQGGKFSILYFDHNQLSGPIPDTLDQMPLYCLNFSNNRITGSIPDSLGAAHHLLSLDLSFNELSGPLPSSLCDLTLMNKFNVSYNNLSGPILTANQFATYNSSVYAGNPFLCYVGNPYASSSSFTSQVLQQCGGSSVPSRQSGRPNSSSSRVLSLSLGEILGISVGSTAFVLVVAGCVCFAIITRRSTLGDPRFDKVGGDRDRLHSSRDLLKIPVSAFGTDSLPKALKFIDLLFATNNFDDGNIIGDGGFGVVYRAKLLDGSVVAIKKLIQVGAEGEREFAAEMLTLGSIRHNNLVPLLGYCASDKEKLLVYKCMTNGSLDEWLHDRPGGKEVLSWARRVNIASGAARGLAFLHHNCSPIIIHRDMKASNILLDDNFCACLTDFGLARRMYGKDTHVSTIVAGTLGYVPPEYSQTWRSTTRGDVYSFGVVLLELITGRRPTGYDFDDDGKLCLGGNVVDWVRILFAQRKHEEAYDPTIRHQGGSQELLQFLKLGVVCTEDVSNNRPSMRDVTTALDQIQLALIRRSPTQAFL